MWPFVMFGVIRQLHILPREKLIVISHHICTLSVNEEHRSSTDDIAVLHQQLDFCLAQAVNPCVYTDLKQQIYQYKCRVIPLSIV